MTKNLTKQHHGQNKRILKAVFSGDPLLKALYGVISEQIVFYGNDAYVASN